MTAVAMRPGFADPVHDAQRTFRAVLAAMARPGTVHAVAGLAEAPAPLSPVMAAVALTLLDHETSAGLAGALDCREVQGYLAFHSGARTVAVEHAAYVLAAAVRPALAELQQGTPEYPDRSATLIVEAGRLGSGKRVKLRGPGIKEVATFAASGLDAEFWREAAANNAGYPLGVDTIFCLEGGFIAALPRSTAIEA